MNILSNLYVSDVSHVSHEIQSPLTSIRGFAKALCLGNTSAEERLRYLTIIEEETLRLSRLSDNLFRLAALEAETIAYNPIPYRLDRQVVDMVLAREPLWRINHASALIKAAGWVSP
ncbi:histidine kinase dimerization/phospho-acceptor domain-containing protein [Desulfitobacterium hafniense]|uniref:histidine kinase dimerization/phospho-acceptor domain-containing protein n=1 Tax=Desulfitobacterium hafniense TaxID=49338 RepID=UPI0009B7D001